MQPMRVRNKIDVVEKYLEASRPNGEESGMELVCSEVR